MAILRVRDGPTWCQSWMAKWSRVGAGGAAALAPAPRWPEAAPSLARPPFLFYMESHYYNIQGGG
jgi:hypothetical protein